MSRTYSPIEFATEVCIRNNEDFFGYKVITPSEIDDIDKLVDTHWKAMKNLKNEETIFICQVYVSEIARLINLKLPEVDHFACVAQYLGDNAGNVDMNVKKFDKNSLSVDFLCVKKVNGKYRFSTIEANGSGHKPKKKNSQQVVQDAVKSYYLTMMGAKQRIAPSGILDADAKSIEDMLKSIIADCVNI